MSELLPLATYTIPVTGFTATSCGDGIETVVEELVLVEVDVVDVLDKDAEVEVVDWVELLDELEVEVEELTADDDEDAELEEPVVTASEDVSLVVS